MSKILITKQTGVATVAFDLDSSTNLLPGTLTSNGLAGIESIAVEVSDDNGATYSPAIDYNTGSAIKLDATHNIVVLVAAGRYRVVKPITAAAVGLSLSTPVSA